MHLRRALLGLAASALSAVLAHPAVAVTYPVGDAPPFAAAILVEPETGTVLYEYNADLPRSPASTQKLLLQLVVMDALESGRISLTDSVYASAVASRIGGSQVYLREGEVFPLEQLMEAIAISSANDACVAVAERLGGSVGGFVDMMNQRAQSLGLSQTHCVNVHGLDDTPADEGNQTTARDLSRIGASLLRYPQVLEWTSTRYKPFRNGGFMLHTTNRLLGRFPGLDGLKTGYTRRAGFCLVATAERDGMRLLSVVMGASTERGREQESARLLSWGFNNFTRVPVARGGEHLGSVPLEWGVEPEVAAVTADTVVVVLTTQDRQRLKRQVDLPQIRPAPVTAGQDIGQLRITLGDSLLAQVTLVAEKSVARMSLWERLMSYF
ncbi:MAG: D-alanyl-D-alanine carboxypeptidase family protein [Gemmatimonadota bacterium]